MKTITFTAFKNLVDRVHAKNGVTSIDGEITNTAYCSKDSVEFPYHHTQVVFNREDNRTICVFDGVLFHPISDCGIQYEIELFRLTAVIYKPKKRRKKNGT